MTTRRPSSNIFLIAFAAIVGMLSFGDIASACTTKPASAPKACCASRPTAECGCCPSGETQAASVHASRAEAIVPTASRVVAQASTPSCECRASEPAAPTKRPAQRTSSERSEVKGFESFVFLAPATRPSLLAHFALQNESPPKSPLYLRTSRLLI